VGRLPGLLMQSLRRKTSDPPNDPDTIAAAIAASGTSRHSGSEGSMSKSSKMRPNLGIERGKSFRISSIASNNSASAASKGGSFTEALTEDQFGEGGDTATELGVYFEPPRRKSVNRRSCINAINLQMGLDSESANFLDMVLKAKGRDWLKSLSRRDPRACIKAFFDDIALDGADSIEEPGKGFHPELLSPLLSMFQRASVFSVWRPTSIDSIRKMMTGQGTGKGLDIKGKSAKKGKLSAYVPFVQIHDEKHKNKIRSLPKDGRIRVFYKKQDARNNAHKILLGVLEDMVQKVVEARTVILQSEQEESPAAQDPEADTGLPVFGSRESLEIDDDAEWLTLIEKWEMDDPTVILIDDYSPKCYGIDLPKRLFWEGYVMRAADISRPVDSTFDTGRPSRPSFQDMNFSSIKNDWDEDSPRAVVWQYTDPYSPPTEPDPDPMLPQTLLMAYEENGRVLPVVSDFDCFLLGTRGIRFRNPVSADQVELIHEMVDDTEKILAGNMEGRCRNWTSSWLDNMKHKTGHHPMPKYGFGDPKSYAIMRHAVKRLEEFGAVRHGAECFNYYFPQELDDEFLVIGGNRDGDKYQYMKLHELQQFLLGSIDNGYTFPLNPKWVLCDEGWKAIWDKLTGSSHPNVQLSINAWFPPESGLKERIAEIHSKYPNGFQPVVEGKKSVQTGGWLEAEMALESYHRIQRAKRKLFVVLMWISIVQESQQKARGKKENNGDESDEFLDEKKEDRSIPNESGTPIKANDDHENEADLKPSIGALSDSTEDSAYSDDFSDIIDDCSVTKHKQTQRVSFDDSVKAGSFDDRGNGSSVEADDLDAKLLGVAKRFSDGDESSLDSAQILSKSELFSTSSSFSRYDDGDQYIEVVDSLLNSNTLCLSEFQSLGLRRIRDLLISYQRKASKTHQRRHTAHAGNMYGKCLESSDIPLFIAREFGAEVKQPANSFKAQVKKLMAAKRIMTSITRSTSMSSDEVGNNCNHFVPEEWSRLSPETKEKLVQKLSFENLAKWDFDVIELADECRGYPLLMVGWAILGSPYSQQAMRKDLGMEFEKNVGGHNFVSKLLVKIPTICNFLRKMESNYLTNPYHNNTHAADVLQTLNTMMQLGGNNFASSSLEIFCILIAAVIHDVRHPGRNNNFQINSRSEYAVKYNDLSVLENMSVSWFFSQIIGAERDPAIDILSGLSSEQFAKARNLLIKSVLETDMTHHFSLLKKIKIHHSKLKGKCPKEWLLPYSSDGVTNDPSTDMLCFLLHQADISNPAKPYPLFVKWADCVMTESYEQGDKEASMSLPISPLCDRANTDLKQSQVGFIKFVVRPSCETLGEIIPEFGNVVLPHLSNNLTYWENYDSGEKGTKVSKEST